MEPHTYRKKSEIVKVLSKLPGATTPGKSADGAMVRLVYSKRGPMTARERSEARWAIQHKVPLNLYTGKLDKFFTAKDGSPIAVVLVQERRNEDGYCYRAFNLKKGIKELEVISAKRTK